MDAEYVTAHSAKLHMSRLIYDIWNGVTPNNRLLSADAGILAQAEARIAEVRTCTESEPVFAKHFLL